MRIACLPASPHPTNSRRMTSPLVLFNPLELRSGLKYQNLAGHIFSSGEIAWMCAHLANATSNLKRLTYLEQFADRYSLPRTRLSSWVRKYLDGHVPDEGKCERLLDDEFEYPLDAISVGHIQTYITNRISDAPPDRVASCHEFVSIVEWEMAGSERRRGGKFKMHHIEK